MGIMIRYFIASKLENLPKVILTASFLCFAYWQINDMWPSLVCTPELFQSTTVMAFVLRKLQGKSLENMELLVTFVDLTEGIDSRSSEGMWQTIERLGCPQKFLNILRHEDQQDQVGSKQSETFPNINEEKQDCVLASILSSIFIPRKNLISVT